MAEFLKTSVYADSLPDKKDKVHNYDVITVQSFSYKCCRSRNDAGKPYGNTLPSTLEFSCIVGSTNNGKAFLSQMCSSTASTITFLFGASFNENNQLKDYDEYMAVKGYVVDNENTYVVADGQQMVINVKMLINEITYVAGENTKTLYTY